MRKAFLIFVFVCLLLSMAVWKAADRSRSLTSMAAPSLGSSIGSLPIPQNAPHLENGKLILPKQTKFEKCLAQNGLPDFACTPGAIDESRTEESVCNESTKKYRGKFNKGFKLIIFREYGKSPDPKGFRNYEVDHFIPLELGGSNEIANIWPELAEPRPGFHQKDEVENYLHSKVCKEHAMTLAEAQYAIASNWIAVWANMTKNKR